MLAELGLTWQFVLVTTVSIFTIINPLGATPLFVAHTATLTPKERRAVARRASLMCAAVLSIFAMTGQRIFSLLGVSLPALRIAGACLVFLVSLDMLRGANIRSKTLPEEQREAAEKQDISIIPLAVPLLAGPGAITTVIMLMIRAKGWAQDTVVVGCVFFVCLLTFLILSFSSYFLKMIGPSGVRVMNRLMGLILAAISIQFIINGLKDLLPEFAKVLQAHV